jgi:uncharacterized protein (DUF2141 family)
MRSIVTLVLLATGAGLAQPTPEMELTVTGLRSSKGAVRVALFSTAKGWPQQDQHAFRRAVATIEQGRAKVRFGDVPPGTYAAVAFHDEDGDEKLGKNFFGVPSEGWGASNGARALLGPSWEASLTSARAITLAVEY